MEQQRVTAELKQAEQRLKSIYDDAGKEEEKTSTSDKADSSDQDVRQKAFSIRNKFLTLAKNAIDNNDIFSAWGYLLAFNRMMVGDMQGSELDARIESARSEAKKKLSGWRGKAVKNLLAIDSKIGNTKKQQHLRATDSQIEDEERQQRLREALFHLHSKSQNMYFKIGKIRNQIVIAGIMLSAATVAVFVLSFWFMCFSFFDDITRSEFHLAMLSGIVGGVLSVAFSLVHNDQEQDIPELIASLPLTWSRILFGPLVAFALLILFELDVINLGTHEAESLIGMSFIAGFSERWFLNLVNKVQEKAGA
jgi:hypothetical protein